MKNKIVASILLILLLTFTLFSCNIFNKDDTSTDGSNGENDGNGGETLNGVPVIFSPTTSVSVIRTSDKSVDLDLSSLVDTIFDITGKFATLNSDASPESSNELVFGKTTRNITAKAYSNLEKSIENTAREYEDAGKETKHIVGYAVYAEGGSVAIVWSDSTPKELALEYFTKNYLTGATLALRDGYCDAHTFSLVEYYAEIDEAKKNDKYAEIEALYGPEVVTALKNYLSRYDDRFYFWLADLYDPGEYDENGNPLGGGFYATNSGRDTVGYSFDIETTRQVFSFLQSSGMFDGGSVKELTPQKMQNEILAYVLSCQSPVDGYFYNPQWGSNVIMRRLSRDLSSATQLLNLFGAKPYWTTPNGHRGINGDPPGEAAPVSMTWPISYSRADAVSKVIATATAKKWTGLAHLNTLATWENYLNSFEGNISVNSYSIGSDFSSISSQIKTRDEMAIANGELTDIRDVDGNLGPDGIADGGYVEMFKTKFDSWQFEKSGLWEDCSLEEDNVYYNAISGLMKICSSYNSLGIELPNYEKAFASAVHMVTFMGDEEWRDCKGKQPSSCVDVYNPWVSLNYIFTNLKKTGKESEIEVLREQLKKNALEMINATVTKTAKFKRDDGSYSYRWGAGSGKNQGSPVGIPNTLEGDVNGAGIAYTGIFNNMCEALGIEGLTPLGNADRIKFFSRIEELEHVIKDEEIVFISERITFDDDLIGTSEPELVTTLLNKGSVEVIEDPRDKNSNVLKLISEPNGTNYINVSVGDVKDPKKFVLEWEMCFTDIKSAITTGYQIKLSSAYMLTLGLTADGLLTVSDASNTSGSIVKNTYDIKLSATEWNKFRIEYYVLDAEAKETVTKIFINDDLRFLSNNYMGKHDPEALPSNVYTTATFLALKATDFTVLFDNIYAYQSSDSYVEEEIYNPDRIKDFDSVEPGTAMPSGVTTVGGEIVSSPTEENADNNVLELDGKGKSVTVNSVSMAAGPNCYAFTTDMKIDGDVGKIGKLTLATDVASAPYLVYEIEIYKEGDVKYAKLNALNDKGATEESFVGLPVGEWFKLTVEFYPYRYLTDSCSVIYCNGTPIGRGSVYYTINSIARAYTSVIIQTTADATITIDIAIAEKIEKAFINADGEESADPDITLPTGGNSSNVAAGIDHDGRFDFESSELGTPSIAGLKTVVNSTEYGNNLDIVKDPKDEANKVLMIQAAATSGTSNRAYFTASKLSPSNASCYAFEFDILLDHYTAGSVQLMFLGTLDGKEVTMFNTEAYFTGSTINFRSKTYDTDNKLADRVYFLSTTLKDGWNRLRFEFYADEGKIQIYLGGIYLGETDLYYKSEYNTADFTCAQFYMTKNSSCRYYLDNVVVESIKKDYTAQTPPTEEDDDKPSGDTSGGATTAITGEYDFTDNTVGSSSVNGIKGSMGGGSVSVSTVTRDDKEENVLEVATKNGSTASLSITPGKLSDGVAKSFVMEFDILFASITTGSNSTGLRFQIGNSYLLCLTVNANGTFAIKDTTTTNSGLNPNGTTTTFDNAKNVDAYSWHRIKVEYTVKDGEALINVYLDGTPIGTSTNYWNQDGSLTEAPIDFSVFTVYCLKSLEYTFYLDNIVAKELSE